LSNKSRGKPGRPRTIPLILLPRILSLHADGLGYRAIAHILAEQDIAVTYSTVRRVIKERSNEE
jgi:transposase-like protein